MSDRTYRSLRAVEALFIIAGVLCFVTYGAVLYRAFQYQRMQSLQLDRAIAEMDRARTEKDRAPAERDDAASASESPTITRPSSQERSAHQLVGRLEIPRVRLSVMVVDGDDEHTLKLAAGHLPETPLPWEFGNSAVAGHRDTFFRPLSEIRVNDRLRLVTPFGDFNYKVSKLRIVEPDDLSVLAQTGRSSLTLVTCYPFSYVGRAPKRFVVRADHIPG